MSAEQLNGLSNNEANSVVAAGCVLLAAGLAGAVGQGLIDDGAYFVEILAPESGQRMLFVGKEQGRYVLRGKDGRQLAEGRTLGTLFAARDGAPPRYAPCDGRYAKGH